jgi:excisionase family DNA binding protein
MSAHRPREAARLLGISVPTLYRMLGRGEITAVKLGRATIITDDELARVLSAAPVATIRPPAARPAPGAEPAEAA